MCTSIQNFFFDLDGTLVDSAPGIEFSVRAALAELGFDNSSANLRALIGPPIRIILQRLIGPAAEPQLDALESAFRRSYDSEGWRKTECYARVEQTLRNLSIRGCVLFVVTNKPRLATERILEKCGIRPLFREVLTRDAGQGFCSKRDMLCHLLQRYGLHAAACLMVGDTREDCDAANEAGMPAALVLHGYGQPAPRNRCRLLGSLAELVDAEERGAP